MVWTVVRPNSKRLNKGTRWDRIRKKHANGFNMKTTLVKKFVEMDFIGKNNMKLLNGDIDLKQNLDPNLVMDLRHEMFQKNPKKSASSVKKYTPNIDKCIVHNLEVEEHYILNELSKFRAQLEKNRQQCRIKPKILNSSHFNVDNNIILKSLENTSRYVEDFYEAPLRAIRHVANLGTHLEDKSNEVNVEDEDTNLESIPMGIEKNKQDIEETRYVRFEEAIGIVQYEYSREASIRSNTSDGIDSVISDLAEDVISKIKVETDIEKDKIKLEDNFEINGSSLHNNSIEPLIITKILPDQVKVKEEIITSAFSNSSEDIEESVSNEQNAIIEQLFQSRSLSNMVILKNYFLKWIHYMTIQKIERENNSIRNDRIQKINAFLDHIRREKRNQKSENPKPVEESKIQAVNITKKYKSKIKIQQDIIDLQKLKLERQERLITELKLSKLSEEAKEDRDQIKIELKNALRTCDSKSRAKSKCLQILGNLRDKEDEEFARLQGKAMIQPKFLTNMQERALIRSVKHEQAKQRRLQHEAEREAAKMAIEEAKRLEDEESKRMRLELLREKRRQEKMAKILKEREHQKAIENNKKSQEFCRYYLLRRIGMECFKRVLERKKLNQRKAEVFRKQLLKKNVFCAWKRFYLLVLERKIYLADEFYAKILKRMAMEAWACYLHEERCKYLVAIDWHELKLCQFVFTRWNGYTKLQKLIEDMKMKQAELHHEWHLKWKVVDRWQCLPQILKLEKETEERRQRWRMKIWELLPDYTPNRDQIF